MNEVTKIHLGRQAFTISVDAHHELKSYLAAINKQVRDKDVLNEIELRMAELLSERGINGNKVILPGDVDFLKAQLGDPNDFKGDEDGTTSSASSKSSDSKRLYRDTDNAILAGVASGLAQYLGVDALLVRIVFVIIVVITAGWGILLYIVLWLLVPEAKTSSERLKMAGKAVNVDSLKEIVERADVKGAAHRANTSLAGFINTLFGFAIKVVGIGLTILGLSAIFGLIASEAYLLFNGKTWDQYNIFPIGFREHLLLDIAMAVVALIAAFVIVFGIATFRRKWPIRSWVTGILVGLLLIGLSVGGALTANVYPNVRDRYNDHLHTSIRNLAPFDSMNVGELDVNTNFQYSSSYYVSLTYYGNPNLSGIETSVQNKTLNINTDQFNPNRNCQTLCIPSSYNLTITVYSPTAEELANKAGYAQPQPPIPPYEP